MRQACGGPAFGHVLQQAGLWRDAVAIRAAPLKPILVRRSACAEVEAGAGCCAARPTQQHAARSPRQQSSRIRAPKYLSTDYTDYTD